MTHADEPHTGTLGGTANVLCVIVDCAAYADGKRATGTLALDEVSDQLGKDDRAVWIGLRMPRREELADVFATFGIDELDIDEVLSPHDRPVLTRDEDITVLVLRTARYEPRDARFSLGELSVIIGERFVITVRHGSASPLSNLRSELERDPELLQFGRDAIVAGIVTQVIDDYGPALDAFERDVVDVESAVFDENRAQPVKRIYDMKRNARELFVAIDALQAPLLRLVHVSRFRWDEEVLYEMQEAGDQLNRTVKRVRSLMDLLTSAIDANLTQVSVRQNEDMRKISAWVAIAAVPTMIAGLYGMNFEHMPELEWELGYPVALAFIGIVCTLLYRNFRKSGWL